MRSPLYRAISNQFSFRPKYKFSSQPTKPQSQQQSQPLYKYKFQYGIDRVVNPHRVTEGGDDAHFISDNMLVVADGVGGWCQSQQTNNQYSSRLMRFIQKMYIHQNKKAIQNPLKVAEEAVSFVKAMGSSTLSILTLNPDSGEMKSYYIGDSVYGIFKDKQVEMVRPQMVSFNKPYQVGEYSNNPSQGYQNTYEREAIGQKDIIVLASDGLWDNVKLGRLHYEIRGPNSVNEKSKKPKTISQITTSVVKLAQQYSLTQNYESPFYLKAKQKGIKLPAKMGKVDDITVILAKIVKSPI